VIGEPLDEGKDQSILMLLPTCVVTGASGISGTVAHKMLNSSEKSERPNWFLGLNSKLICQSRCQGVYYERCGCVSCN